MNEIKTPISDARNRYRSLRRRRRRLSHQERVWYYQLRWLQNHTANWRKSRKSQLVSMAAESLEKTTKTLADWQEFHDWFTAQESQVSSNNRNFFQVLCDKIDNEVGLVREVVDDYADDESILETIVDSVIAAGYNVGLEPYEPWEEADDGAVWFVNPETGFKHYFLLGRHHSDWEFEVMSRPITSLKVERGWNQWEQFPGLDLSHSVLTWSNPKIHHPARWLDAYFGAYNGLGIVERDLPESVDRALDQLKNIRRRTA